MLTRCTTGAFARPPQRQVVHYAGQMLIDGHSVAPRSRPPLREGAHFCRYQADFWCTSQCISMGQSSRGRSNTSRPLTQSAYQLVGGHAPAGRFAFSYSYTEWSEASCRGKPETTADTCSCVKMVV